MPERVCFIFADMNRVFVSFAGKEKKLEKLRMKMDPHAAMRCSARAELRRELPQLVTVQLEAGS